MRMPDLVLGSISLKCTGNSHKRLEADDRIVAANAVLPAIADACLANPRKTDAGAGNMAGGGARGDWSYDISVFSFFYSWKDALLLS